jgi:hypothetical protein
MTATTGDWPDALAGALTLMAIAVGPEIAEEIMIRDTFEDACRKADRRRKPDGLDHLRGLLDEGVSLEQAYQNVVVLNANEAPQATIEALTYALRRGVEELFNESTLVRLARLSESQAKQVAERLRKFKPNIAVAWKLDEVEALLRIWSLRHGR